LDGDPSFPLPSGDGLEGGNFAVTFDTDAPAAAAFPTPVVARLPRGSLIFDSSSGGVNSPAADTDSFALLVDAGPRISGVVTPLSAGLQPTVTLSGAGIAPTTVIAPAAGQRAVLNTAGLTTGGTAGETYTVTVGGAAGTGAYTVQIVLGAALELET